MGKRKKFSLLILLSALLMTTACSVRIVRGSGDLISETRQISNFDSIELSGSGEVIVTQDGSESLRIETDDNVMEYVKAQVRGGTLELGFEDGVEMVDPSRLAFYVGVDDLTGLIISGSGDLESDRIETNRLNATVSGSGDVQISDLSAGEVITEISGSGEVYLDGEVGSQNITISGSGQYRAGDLCSGTVSVTISGSGDAMVCATQTLDTTISGSGSVQYYGQPSVHTSGSGSGSTNSLGDH